MSRKIKTIGFLLVLIVLLEAAGYFFIIPVFLSSDYVREKICAIAKSSMQAELSFDKFEADIKTGHILLTDMAFVQEKPETTFKAKVRAASMDIELMPLLRKKVHIRKLELESPSISLVRRADTDESGKEQAGGEESKKFKPCGKIVVDEIIIKNGEFDYISDTADGVHTEANFGKLDYTATNITSETLARLVSSSSLEVTDVKVIQKSLKTDLDLSTERVLIQNDMEKLKTDLYKVDAIEISRPEIIYTVQRDAEKPSTGTKDKIINLINMKLSGPESRKEEKKENSERFLYSIASLKIDGGQLEYTAKREGMPPFEAKLTNMEYHARDLAYETFGNLVINADIDADIDMGGMSKLHKQTTKDSSEFYLTDVNFGYTDRYFSQKDAIVIDSGNIDVSYKFDEEYKGFYDVQLRDFKIANNPDDESQKFMFIPVTKIIDFVNSREGKLDLRFELDSKFEVSDDLEDIVMKVWDGMWSEIFKYITAEGIEGAIEKLPLNEKAEQLKGFIEKTIKEHKKE